MATGLRTRLNDDQIREMVRCLRQPKVLEQCLEHFRTVTQPAESQTASQATPSAPEREVLLLAAPAGTGATALLLHLASLLSLEGQNVLSVLGGTTLEPTDFRHALSIAAGMPGELATKVDSVMTELGQVQHAVLNARNYETSIVHDVQNYLKGSKEANTNFWIMSHWVRVSGRRVFVLRSARCHFHAERELQNRLDQASHFHA